MGFSLPFLDQENLCFGLSHLVFANIRDKEVNS